MKEKTIAILDELTGRIPELLPSRGSLLKAYEAMAGCFAAGGKLMACGNGGSAADAEHIIGELMKGYKLPRRLPKQLFAGLTAEDGSPLAGGLQGALPALALSSHTALTSAFINDVSPAMVYAQQVFALGKPGDVLLGISTSGNSANVLNAIKVAKAMGIATVGLTGGDGGRLAGLVDIAIIAPTSETYRVQEYHLPIYHALCAMLEETFFGK